MFIYIYIIKPRACAIASKLHYTTNQLQITSQTYSLIHCTRNYNNYQPPQNNLSSLEPYRNSKNYIVAIELFLRNFCVMCRATNRIKGLQHYTNITRRNVIMVITNGINGINGWVKVLIVFWIATNLFLLPSIRISVGLWQLRVKPALDRRHEPAPALGRMFAKPRAVRVSGGNLGGNFFS